MEVAEICMGQFFYDDFVLLASVARSVYIKGVILLPLPSSCCLRSFYIVTGFTPELVRLEEMLCSCH